MMSKGKVSRPASARTRPTNTLSSEQQPSLEMNTPQSSSNFLKRFEQIKSNRQKQLSRPSSAKNNTQEVKTASQSNFLRKFDRIREQRSPGNDRPTDLNQPFEMKINNMSIKHSFTTSLAVGGNRPKQVHSEHLNEPQTRMKDLRPRSGEVKFVNLCKIQQSQLILPKQIKEGKELLGYWPAEGQYVSVIPLQKNEKVDFKHPNILPIHAEVVIGSTRYVVTDQYRNCSLRSLLLEFGRLPQRLAKRYIRQVILGLQHMHFHNQAHNRLTTRTVFHNLNGQLFINPVKATSFTLSKEELSKLELHSFAPEFILSRTFSRGLKNDIWSLGCLALQVLGHQLSVSGLHPYNWTFFEDPRQELQIDNLRAMNLPVFSGTKSQQKGSCPQLSPQAIKLLKACLQVLPQKRPSLQVLLEFQFFEGV